MRKIARVKKRDTGAVWLIVYAREDGAYVFPLESELDGSSGHDDWFETLAEADDAASDIYGIDESDWIGLADPALGLQQDWVAPVRVRGRDAGAPEWGCFERLVNGEWVAVGTVADWTVAAAIQQWHRADSRTVD
jgi:hypothetical protein